MRMATGAVPIAGAHIARKVSHATNSANKLKKSRNIRRNIRNGDVEKQLNICLKQGVGGLAPDKRKKEARDSVRDGLPRINQDTRIS